MTRFTTALSILALSAAAACAQEADPADEAASMIEDGQEAVSEMADEAPASPERVATGVWSDSLIRSGLAVHPLPDGNAAPSTPHPLDVANDGWGKISLLAAMGNVFANHRKMEAKWSGEELAKVHRKVGEADLGYWAACLEKAAPFLPSQARNLLTASLKGQGS